jgi:hypothetical protein
MGFCSKRVAFCGMRKSKGETCTLAQRGRDHISVDHTATGILSHFFSHELKCKSKYCVSYDIMLRHEFLNSVV